MAPKPPILDYVSAPKRLRQSWTLLATLIIALGILLVGALMVSFSLMRSPNIISGRDNPAFQFGVILILLALRCGFAIYRPSKDSILRWNEKPQPPKQARYGPRRTLPPQRKIIKRLP